MGAIMYGHTFSFLREGGRVSHGEVSHVGILVG